MGVWDRHHKPQGIWGRGYRVPVNEMGTEPPMWLELRWVRGPPWGDCHGACRLGPVGQCLLGPQRCALARPGHHLSVLSGFPGQGDVIALRLGCCSPVAPVPALLGTPRPRGRAPRGPGVLPSGCTPMTLPVPVLKLFLLVLGQLRALGGVVPRPACSPWALVRTETLGWSGRGGKGREGRLPQPVCWAGAVCRL